jgi:hypothetical protein
MSLTLLQALQIREVSAVDSGAHQLDGWIVQKRKGIDRAESERLRREDHELAEILKATYLRHPQSGRFASQGQLADAHRSAPESLIPWNHLGAVHPGLGGSA